MVIRGEGPIYTQGVSSSCKSLRKLNNFPILDSPLAGEGGPRRSRLFTQFRKYAKPFMRKEGKVFLYNCSVGFNYVLVKYSPHNHHS